MKACGLIVEYNPFHYGHVYHIEQAKKISNADVIIAIMSPTFTQRGEPALVDKRARTKIALEYGVNLVIELPSIYAIESANHFAYGALKLLNELQVDYLVFGSESNDVNSLIDAAKVSQSDEYQSLVRKYIKENQRYANACNLAFQHYNIPIIDQANDILALAYVQEIVKYKYPIQPLSIKRTNDFLSQDLTGKISSASAIRKALENDEDINEYTPMKLDYKKTTTLESIFFLLKYQLTILSHEQIQEIHGFDEGLEFLFLKHINQAQSMQEFIELTTSKRYPSTRIKRAIIHLISNLSKKDYLTMECDYLRVLGFDDVGQAYLKQIKQLTDYHIITTFSNFQNNTLEYEWKVSKVYELLNPYNQKNIDLLTVIKKDR